MKKPKLEWTIEHKEWDGWKQCEHPIKFATCRLAAAALNAFLEEQNRQHQAFNYRVVRNDTKRKGEFVYLDQSDMLLTRDQLKIVITAWEHATGLPYGVADLPSSYRASSIVSLHEAYPFKCVRISLHDLRGTYGDKLWRVEFGKDMEEIWGRRTVHV